MFLSDGFLTVPSCSLLLLPSSLDLLMQKPTPRCLKSGFFDRLGLEKQSLKPFCDEMFVFVNCDKYISFSIDRH